MKPSSTNLFKSFASKIHPQVVLSKKESKHFLNALTTSFRHQLDAEHPHDYAVAAGETKSGPLSLAQKHVASVLTNPLFAYGASSGLPNSGSIAPGTARHPIDIFEACVANGTATLETASQCLSAFRRLLRKGKAADSQSSIRHHQPGTKVLQWLWANDLAHSAMFEGDNKLYKAVVFFLAREGRMKAIRNWIDTASGEATSSLSSSPKSMLLDWLVTCQIKSGKSGINTALATFNDIVRQCESGSAQYTHLAGAQLLATPQIQDQTPILDKTLLLQFLEGSGCWQTSDMEPLAVEIMRQKLRFVPFSTIDGALQLATKLDITQARSLEAQYGERVVQFLVALSDAIQKVGNQAQADRFIKLLQTVEQSEQTPTESLLSRATRGIPSLLLQEFDKLDFSPRHISVPI